MSDNLYKDLYKEKYIEYLEDRFTKERAAVGKAPYARQTILTFATDTFYLEKHSNVDFKYWFTSDQTLDEADKELDRILAENGRDPDSGNIGSYKWDLRVFRDFLREKNHEGKSSS